MMNVMYSLDGSLWWKETLRGDANTACWL